MIKLERVLYMLFVSDRERATAFYRDVIGLKVASASPRWTELTFGDATVALHLGGNARTTGLAFTVADIGTAVRSVEAGGGKTIKAPVPRLREALILAQMSDTEGNEFEMGQRMKVTRVSLGSPDPH